MTMVDVLGVGGTVMYGLRVGLIGMLVVFTGLIILIVTIKFLSLVLHHNDIRKGQFAGNAPNAGFSQTKAALETGNITEVDDSEDEIVAVISAVLAMMESQKGDQKPELTVMERKGNASAVRTAKHRQEAIEYTPQRQAL